LKDNGATVEDGTVLVMEDMEDIQDGDMEVDTEADGTGEYQKNDYSSIIF
jgi:hypothetical protein